MLTATAAWLDARAAGGEWRLRIDDLDRPRVVPGAEANILATLEGHGLTWDGIVSRQSERHTAYRDAFETLSPWCFACTCSRRELRGHQTYPGTCRNRLAQRLDHAADRMIVADAPITFQDRLQGQYAENLGRSVGDFIVWRRDGFASYQLAVVVDDALDRVTHIVRGADLIDNTPRQMVIRERLSNDRPVVHPEYLHLPVIAEAGGIKLSKHNAATAIDVRFARMNLTTVLDLLGHSPPARLTTAEMLDWAVAEWRVDRVPPQREIDGYISI